MAFNKEFFESMKLRRGIPFLKRHMRVEIDGKPGKIVGNYGDNLLVKLDGYKRAGNCHPHWRVKYFDKNGALIKEFKE